MLGLLGAKSQRPLLFEDLLFQLAVHTLTMLVLMITILLNHFGNALEQAKHTPDGGSMDMLLHMLEQGDKNDIRAVFYTLGKKYIIVKIKLL